MIFTREKKQFSKLPELLSKEIERTGKINGKTAREFLLKGIENLQPLTNATIDKLIKRWIGAEPEKERLYYEKFIQKGSPFILMLARGLGVTQKRIELTIENPNICLELEKRRALELLNIKLRSKLADLRKMLDFK